MIRIYRAFLQLWLTLSLTIIMVQKCTCFINIIHNYIVLFLLTINSLAHLAASIGSLETLLLLAQYGADFELQTPKGVKPIHDAAANGQAGTISFVM